jgi:hypothetical protein
MVLKIFYKRSNLHFVNNIRYFEERLKSLKKSIENRETNFKKDMDIFVKKNKDNKNKKK